MQTHDVVNQAQPLVDYNMYLSDPILSELVGRFDAGWCQDRLVAFGQFAGSQQALTWATQSNANEPVLHTHDRVGNRLDLVEFHPAYHNLMSKSIEFGLHSLPWREPRIGAHVARAALLFMAFQNEAGHCCPISMTYSVVPALQQQPDLAAAWQPLICSNAYDSRFLPADKKTGITVGMAMTEKQGGSDLRANMTEAVAVAQPGPGKEYLLRGHKWFCSAPMSDAFLVTAKTIKGLSCFLVPRHCPDGSKNNFFIQRLKDKLGNRSNASSEIELEDTLGFLVGKEGRGVPTIIEMVNHTRLDCGIGSAALMCQALRQALHHCHYRSAFGKKLSEQPLMMSVLADLALEAESSLRMIMRVARSYDCQGITESEKHFRRIATAIAKYWICKRAPSMVAEALECWGGNGYVEAGPMPRLFRESPLLGIWEGSGNVICLDVLRAVAKEPASLHAFMSELDGALGVDRRFDTYVQSIKNDTQSLLKDLAGKDPAVLAANEQAARFFVERLALALEAALMIQQAPGYVADLFVARRLAGEGGIAFGALPRSANAAAIVERASFDSTVHG